MKLNKLVLQFPQKYESTFCIIQMYIKVIYVIQLIVSRKRNWDR